MKMCIKLHFYAIKKTCFFWINQCRLINIYGYFFFSLAETSPFILRHAVAEPSGSLRKPWQSRHSDYVTRCYFNVLSREVITAGSLKPWLEISSAAKKEFICIWLMTTWNLLGSPTRLNKRTSKEVCQRIRLPRIAECMPQTSVHVLWPCWNFF